MIFLIAIPVIVLNGVLWHMGGQGQKWARQWGVGTVIAIGKAILLWSLLSVWALVYIPILYLVIQLFSYGLNAPIHKVWVWVFGGGSTGDNPMVEFMTRATCGFGWSLAGLVFALVTGHWLYMIVYTVLCTILCGIFGTQADVELSEPGTGCSVALAIFV